MPLKSINMKYSWLLLTDDGGSTSASVDFTIGDENLNTGLFVLFGEVICTWFSESLKKKKNTKRAFQEKKLTIRQTLSKLLIPKKPNAPFRLKTNTF